MQPLNLQMILTKSQVLRTSIATTSSGDETNMCRDIFKCGSIYRSVVKTHAPRTATTVVEIINNFFCIHRYMSVQWQFVVFVTPLALMMMCDVPLRSFRSTNFPDDCCTQFATLLFSKQFAARILEILFYIYRLSSSGRLTCRMDERERDRYRERKIERERKRARAAVLFIITK